MQYTVQLVNLIEHSVCIVAHSELQFEMEL